MQVVETCLRELCSDAGLEPRHFFCRLRAATDGAFLQASAVEPAEGLCRRLQHRFPSLRLHVAPLPLESLAGQRAWVMASVADVRREASHAAEQTTQALQGEVLQPLLHEDGWLLARLPDDYIGWIRDWHLNLVTPETPQAFTERADARVAVPLAILREEPDAMAAVQTETLLGTLVRRCNERSGWAEIEIPGGRRGWLPQTALRDGTGPWPAAGASVLGMVRRFLGVPYVWGGKSPKGFDCSGLTQFVYALHGIHLPRDSDEQFRCGQPSRAFAAGDLLFFGNERVTHVGIAVDGQEFLHARGVVRHDALARDSRRYAADLAGIFQGGRRVLPHVP